MTRWRKAETAARPGRALAPVALVVLCLSLAVPARALFAADAATGEAPAADAESAFDQALRRYDLVSAELQEALDDLEGARPTSGYHERVLSLRRNGSVTIGGELRATYAASESSWKDPGFDPDRPDRGKARSKSGSLALSTARLTVDVRVHDRWRGFVDLTLTGSSGFHALKDTRNPNLAGAGPYTRDYERRDRIDYLNQAYVELMKDDVSGFGFILGRVKMPFGLWRRPNLFAQSFLDAPDLSGSYLMTPDGRDNGVRLPHASRFTDPVTAAMINYELRDIVRFEAALFQERDADATSRRRSDGSLAHRGEPLVPRSWQIGLSIQPLEGWELTAHFRNRHSQSRGLAAWVDSPYRWDFRQNRVGGGVDPRWDSVNGQWSDTGDGDSFGARANEQAFIAGLAVEIPNTKLSVSAEYAHGWNQGFNKRIDSDSLNLGFAYRLTPRLTLHAQGEWLHVKDRSWMAPSGSGWARDTRNNHLYRAFLGGEYGVAAWLTFEAGWQYEYWRVRSSLNDETRINTANMIYAGTRFVF